MTIAELSVLWHDLECGGYDEDAALWRELADAEAGPVLDLGAGTGRVALDLARAGHETVGLDLDPVFCAELRARAGELPVTAVAGDARDYDLGRRFGLIIAPMQTVQLLGGADGRAAFLATARAHLLPGGLLACALADALDAFDAEHDLPPAPDRTEVGGTVYLSRPVAVRDRGDRASIERVREIVAADGTSSASVDVIELHRVDAVQLGHEAAAVGLRPEAPRRIGQTEEYVGSTVAMLRG